MQILKQSFNYCSYETWSTTSPQDSTTETIVEFKEILKQDVQIDEPQKESIDIVSNLEELSREATEDEDITVRN